MKITILLLIILQYTITLNSQNVIIVSNKKYEILNDTPTNIILDSNKNNLISKILNTFQEYKFNRGLIYFTYEIDSIGKIIKFDSDSFIDTSYLQLKNKIKENIRNKIINNIYFYYEGSREMIYLSLHYWISINIDGNNIDFKIMPQFRKGKRVHLIKN